MADESTPTPTFARDPDAAWARYSEQGFLIEPAVFDRAACDALARAAQDLPTARDGSYAPAINLRPVPAPFWELFAAPRLVGIMERLVGGHVSGLQTEFFFCPPGTPGFALHQDNHYVEAPVDAFASAWISLQDVGPDNGGLIVLPGSHREAVLPIQPTGLAAHPSQDPNARRFEAVVPPGYQRLDVRVPGGAVVLLHGHLVHGSHPNRSHGFRRVLLCTYLRRGERFRVGNTARRSEIDVYAAVPPAAAASPGDPTRFPA